MNSELFQSFWFSLKISKNSVKSFTIYLRNFIILVFSIYGIKIALVKLLVSDRCGQNI